MSPGFVTLAFFVAQLALGLAKDRSGLGAASVAVDARTPAQVRVVSQLRVLSQDASAVSRVPENEEALLELFRKKGSTVFSTDEVDAVGTQWTRFEERESGEIKVSRNAVPKFRTARLARP